MFLFYVRACVRGMVPLGTILLNPEFECMVCCDVAKTFQATKHRLMVVVHSSQILCSCTCHVFKQAQLGLQLA